MEEGTGMEFGVTFDYLCPFARNAHESKEDYPPQAGGIPNHFDPS